MCPTVLSIYFIASHVILVSGGGLDIPRAAQHFILKYRNGELGRITLDQIGSESTSEPLVSSKSIKSSPSSSCNIDRA